MLHKKLILVCFYTSLPHGRFSLYYVDDLATYRIDIPHCELHLSMVNPVKDNPIKAIVGAMVKGPMNLSRMPMIPEKPRRISKKAATKRAP